MATASEALIAHGQAPQRHMISIMRGNNTLCARVEGKVVRIYIDGRMHSCCSPAGFAETWQAAKEHARLITAHEKGE